ncbi:MAG TPA: hypothetical protein VM940_04670 [Chthoniobacterales bacterium]|jgi:hypothetical protein|nr:hypothetical protein [Chthoniobacterales bacterium]
MRTKLLILYSSLLALASAGGAPPAQTDLVGTYEGASIRKSPTGQSLVLQLDVTKRDGVYSLAASMNDTNREEGMDHTSNTHWQWTGTGTVRNDRLTFKYDSGDAELGRGTLRRDGAAFILTLGRVRYRLHLSKH